MRKNREITIVGRTVWPVITLTAGVAVLLAWMLLMTRAMWTLLGLGALFLPPSVCRRRRTFGIGRESSRGALVVEVPHPHHDREPVGARAAQGS
jgi:hypothetical protein